MAATEITAQLVTADGLEETTAAANADGNYCTHHGENILHVINGDASDHDVVIDNAVACEQDPDPSMHDETITVTAGEERLINIGESRFKDPTTGRVNWTYSAVTSVSVAVFRRSAKTS